MDLNPSTPAGVVIPRYMKIGGTEVVHADRVERAPDDHTLLLACGARVEFDVTEAERDFPLTGSFFVEDGESGRIISAGEFHANYQAVPQGTDIAEVSAALSDKVAAAPEAVAVAEHDVDAGIVPEDGTATPIAERGGEHA